MTDDEAYAWFSARNLVGPGVKTPDDYVAARIVVRRGKGRWSYAVLVVRQKRGARWKDVVLAAAPILTEPGSPASVSALACMEEAVRALGESKPA